MHYLCSVVEMAQNNPYLNADAEFAQCCRIDTKKVVFWIVMLSLCSVIEMAQIKLYLDTDAEFMQCCRSDTKQVVLGH
jgi:hypothetical protein